MLTSHNKNKSATFSNSNKSAWLSKQQYKAEESLFLLDVSLGNDDEVFELYSSGWESAREVFNVTVSALNQQASDIYTDEW